MNRPLSRKWLVRGLLLGLIAVALLNYNRVLDLITGRAGVSVDISPAAVISPTLPPGFSATVYARDLQGPRLMSAGSDGTLYVAEQSGGRISAITDANHDGKADAQIVVATGFDGPNSAEIYTDTLIVGEHTRVSQLTLGTDHTPTARKVIIPDLPLSGFHHTKTALVRDGKLYLAMGSTCNACVEQDTRRGAVSVYDASGSGGRVFARGLRNAVGLAFNPWNGELWATVNGRDLMGDDTPPETLVSLRDGGDYGWPRCHAGDISDPENGGPDACKGVIAPVAKFQAHMAPIGLAFYKDGPFPAPYNNSVYVAFHGSWNRSSKVGYKVMRVPLSGGKVAGAPEDFMTGFLHDGEVSGRPAGVAVGIDGSLFVSDDKAGIIYRVAYTGK